MDTVTALLMPFSEKLIYSMITMSALCFGMACLNVYLVNRMARTWQQAATPLPLLPPSPPAAPRPQRKPSAPRQKSYSNALALLESEQGEWYVNSVLMNEITKLHKHYERFDRGEIQLVDIEEDPDDEGCDCPDGCDCECVCHDDCDCGDECADDCECACHDDESDDEEAASDESDDEEADESDDEEAALDDEEAEAEETAADEDAECSLGQES